jgi:dimethylargininase
VIRLDSLNTHPDSCFVEDTAVIHNGKAVIANLCPKSRKGEELSIARVLEEFFPCKTVTPPSTLEGGDVIHLPDRLVSGVSQRTTSEAVRQMARWLNVRVDTIADPQVIHLKSHATYIGNNTILSTSRFIDHPAFGGMEGIEVPVKESYAANALSVGGTVLMSKGHPKTIEKVEDAGFEVIVLDMSEFEKCEGALTCLSLLF